MPPPPRHSFLFCHCILSSTIFPIPALNPNGTIDARYIYMYMYMYLLSSIEPQKNDQGETVNVMRPIGTKRLETGIRGRSRCESRGPKAQTNMK